MTAICASEKNFIAKSHMPQQSSIDLEIPRIYRYQLQL